MSSIGLYSFIFVKGNTNGQRQTVEPFDRPGIDGESFQMRGTRAELSTFTSFRDLAFFASAKSNILAYENMVGDVVTVIDDLGNAWANMLVMGVRQINARAIGNAAGGLEANPTATQTCNWEFKKL